MNNFPCPVCPGEMELLDANDCIKYLRCTECSSSIQFGSWKKQTEVVKGLHEPKIVTVLDSCNQCPELIRGRTYGNDGRDGKVSFKCGKNIWGGHPVFFHGEDQNYLLAHKIPEKIPPNCPLRG